MPQHVDVKRRLAQFEESARRITGRMASRAMSLTHLDLSGPREENQPHPPGSPPDAWRSNDVPSSCLNDIMLTRKAPDPSPGSPQPTTIELSPSYALKLRVLQEGGAEWLPSNSSSPTLPAYDEPGLADPGIDLPEPCPHLREILNDFFVLSKNKPVIYFSFTSSGNRAAAEPKKASSSRTSFLNFEFLENP
ncbi:unnamed protein product, partial [Mesorhabditis spiculigera]